MWYAAIPGNISIRLPPGSPTLAWGWNQMRTYQVCNAAILPGVIRLLRRDGYRAWAELDSSAGDVLCTDAEPAIVGLCAGHGLWATFLYPGLPR